MSFQFLTKCCEWRGRLDVDRKTVPESRAGSSKRTIADSNKSRRTDVKETGGRRAQPASTSRRQIGDVLRCNAVKSSVHKDRLLELDALGRLKPVETGESICNMLRATETGDRTSCRVDDGLEAVKQAGRLHDLPLKSRTYHLRLYLAV